MTDISFKRAVTVLGTLMIVFVVMALSPRVELKAPTSPTKELAGIESYKRERDAWCSANAEVTQRAIALTELRISDGTMPVGLRLNGKDHWIPLTTVTISGTFWQELDTNARNLLEFAVRCHSDHRYGGQMRFVDPNGAVLQKAKFD